MHKVVHCRDVGFDCDGVIHAESEEQALKLAAEHAKTVHGVTVTEEVATKVRAAMRDAPPAEGDR